MRLRRKDARADERNCPWAATMTRVGDVNLRVLKRSRPKPQQGDVFTCSPAPERFLFGRVILTDLPSGRAPMPGSNLVYIYGVEQQTPTPAPLDELAPTKLLIPPQLSTACHGQRATSETSPTGPSRQPTCSTSTASGTPCARFTTTSS